MTLERWIERGKEARNGSPLRAFFSQVEEAESAAISGPLAVIHQAIMNGDGKLALDYLKARFPDRFGPRSTLTIETSGGAPSDNGDRKTLDDYGLNPEQIELLGDQLAMLESGKLPEVPVLTLQEEDDEDDADG